MLKKKTATKKRTAEKGTLRKKTAAANEKVSSTVTETAPDDKKAVDVGAKAAPA